MKKLERKDFLKIAGGTVVGGLSGFVFSGAPFRGYQSLVEWTQDQYVPKKGIEKYFSTICTACPYQCSITAKTAGDRIVRINSSSASCPIGQNALQLLYHPERLKKPLKRVGKKGNSSFVEISWEEAIKAISAKINKTIDEKNRDKIVAINKEDNISAKALKRLLLSIGSNHTYIESNLHSIENSIFNGNIKYDFEKTDYILNFGAEILNGWGNESSILKSFSNWKKKKVSHIHIGTNRTASASHADKWIAIKPGTEGILAIGIAN